MPVVQSYKKPLLLREPDAMKIGGGIFHNPYSGNGMRYKHPYYGKQGEGFSDIFSSLTKTGLNFFKDHASTIADAANIASGVANVVKTAKDIKRADEELYELKRIKDEIAVKNNASKFTPAQLEIMNKIRNTGGGLKIK